jgi:hypothetical protein
MYLRSDIALPAIVYERCIWARIFFDLIVARSDLELTGRSHFEAPAFTTRSSYCILPLHIFRLEDNGLIAASSLRVFPPT